MDLFEESQKKGPPCELIGYETLKECPSKLKSPNVISGNFIIKVPVILSILEVDIGIKANLLLEEPASDIIRFSNKVFLERSVLIHQADKLFLSGTISKAIEYAPWVNSENHHSTPVRQCVFNIPFKCVTKVQYLTPPRIYINPQLEASTYYAETESANSGIRYYNERILCELLDFQFDSNDCSCKEQVIADNLYIQKLEESISLRITLKLIQNQDIEITNPMLRTI